MLQEDGEGFLLFDTSRPLAGLESGKPLPRDSASLDETVRTCAPVYRPDIRSWLHPNPADQAFIQAGLLTTLSVPLVVAGHCFGTLNAAAAGVDAINPTHREALRLIGSRLAHVIKSCLSVRALIESEARFRAVFNSVSDGLLVADLRSRRFVMANPAMCKLLARDPSEIPSLRLEDLFPPSEMPAVMRRLESTAKETTISVTPEVPLAHKDGSFGLVDIGTSVMVFDGRECIVGLFRDADERKRRERAMLQAEKLESVRTLAAGIAHDFNNLLTGVVGNISLAQMKLPADHPVRRSLDDAQHACAQATALTRQLLTFTKGGKPIRSVMDLSSVIRDTALLAVQGSKVTCTLDLQPSTWQVTADGSQISQVVRNLAINAAEAMPDGGTVHLSMQNSPPDARYPYERVCVTVQDQGPGIPSDQLDKVFLPFFTTKKKGNGLGLSVVYSIITNHDGQVEVDSEVGKGTTVRFWLPASPTKDDRSESAAPGPVAEGARRILLMDDEELVRRAMAAILRQAGYETTCVSDGKEAVDAYLDKQRAGTPFDLVILDLKVPGGMGGRQAAAEILATDAGARIVACSGYSADEVMSDPERFGLVGVIPKPFDARGLRDEVKRILGAGGERDSRGE